MGAEGKGDGEAQVSGLPVQEGALSLSCAARRRARQPAVGESATPRPGSHASSSTSLQGDFGNMVANMRMPSQELTKETVSKKNGNIPTGAAEGGALSFWR